MTRDEFLEWAGQEIVVPRLMDGYEPFDGGYYWSGLVSKGTHFAVDALMKGTIRVHLYSSKEEVKQHWNKRLATVPPVPVSRAWASPVRRNNGNGKRAYIGFEWEVSSRDYGREQNPVRQAAGWIEYFYRAQ